LNPAMEGLGERCEERREKKRGIRERRERGKGRRKEKERVKGKGQWGIFRPPLAKA